MRGLKNSDLVINKPILKVIKSFYYTTLCKPYWEHYFYQKALIPVYYNLFKHTPSQTAILYSKSDLKFCFTQIQIDLVYRLLSFSIHQTKSESKKYIFLIGRINQKKTFMISKKIQKLKENKKLTWSWKWGRIFLYVDLIIKQNNIFIFKQLFIVIIMEPF